MNKETVIKLLKKWDATIDIGEQVSKMKAQKNVGGLMGRIQRTVGRPVIFDTQTLDDQKIIQNSLCKELPQWSDVIRSQPEIMDGFKWTRGDFIELYFGHFRMVVEKIRKIIDK
ncbi:hypothetical protein LCGC14_0219750 [marine sediment metagenome]|uniref:Uncharacterized protein n=1 Tax=marine sediment metagenome TaxID=412755 RepID=A0A0F9UD45_9ZZZZ